MYMACRHIKTNGLRCKSPALNGGQFCYYHARLRTAGVDIKFGPLMLPPPEDPAAIQLSVARINEAILNGLIDLPKAATILSGLRLAAKSIDFSRNLDEPALVQSTERNTAGEDIAPQAYVCDFDDQCSECPYADVCTHRADHEDESGHGSDDEEEDE